eukprot:Nitzschia sp. Nitz4//scaffold128_size63911//31137//32989//NITZ4_006220-RA/size63911-processed-gene-0.133-mRNA-1//-1//CDS//3329534835//4136//frame0
MRFLFLVLVVVLSLDLTSARIIFANVEPINDSIVTLNENSVQISADVTDSKFLIRKVRVDLRQGGEKVYKTLPKMANVSETSGYTYIAYNLAFDLEYCFRLRAQNSKGKKRWSPYQCFTMQQESLEPTSSPVSLLSNSTNPTIAPKVSNVGGSFSLTQAPAPKPTIVSLTASPAESTPTQPTTRPTRSPTARPTTIAESELTYGLQPDCFVADPTKFSICLDLLSSTGKFESYMSSFGSARDMWEKAITANGIYFHYIYKLNTAYAGSGAYPSVIDGVYISSNFSKIDGAGNILGYAGPIYMLKTGTNVKPLTGRMVFDVEDLDWMLSTPGTLEGVMAHEMGHVLGIGTLWKSNKLYNYPDGNLYFGPNVLKEWQSQGCSLVDSGAPIVELDGGSGTAGGHFDEACFSNELMTGYVDDGMVLSNLTLGSLADLGYTINYDMSEEFDLSGPCCNSRRRLGESDEMRDSSMRRKRRRLTAENERKAKEFGYSLLSTLQSEEGGNEFLQDADIELSQTVSVYVMQDGHVIDLEVRLEDNIFDLT